MNTGVSVLDILDIEPAAQSRQPKQVLDEKDVKMVCLLMAIGESQEAICRKLNLAKREVEKILTSDDGVELIIRLQTSLCPDPKIRVKKLAHLALDTQTKILLRSTSDATLAKVAVDVLDRSMGKATQVIEQRNLGAAVTDMAAADRALKAADERLSRLEAVQQKLLRSRQVSDPVSK